MGSTKRRLVLVGLLTLLVGCDHATKIAAKSELEGNVPHQVIRGVVDLHYAENTDVGFNLLRWMPEAVRVPLLTVAGAAVLAALLVALLGGARRPRVHLALLFITAGALGNYADRLFRGYVIDFIHLRYWPVFNVADVYVVFGAALLFVASFAGRTGGLSPHRT